MRNFLTRAACASVAVLGMLLGGAAAVQAKTLGVVALIANDALNIAVIAGATDAAKAAGWDVKVVDTQASADQANAAMSSFAVQKVDAIFVLAFASSSIGSGMAAANDAGIPVATWAAKSSRASSSRRAVLPWATTRSSICWARSATPPTCSP